MARSIESSAMPGAWNGPRPDGAFRSRARSATRSITSASSRQREPSSVAPLIAQGERREDKNAIGRSARGQLAQDQAGFDRLALANGIGQQQPGGRRLEPRPAPATAGEAAALSRDQLEPPLSRAGHAVDGHPATQACRNALDTLRARRGPPSSRIRSNGSISVSRSGASGTPEGRRTRRTDAVPHFAHAPPCPPSRHHQRAAVGRWQFLQCCVVRHVAAPAYEAC